MLKYKIRTDRTYIKFIIVKEWEWWTMEIFLTMEILTVLIIFLLLKFMKQITQNASIY